MKNKKNKKEELQSRRQFFRKAAQTALPILGAVVLSQVPSIMKANTPSDCEVGCLGECSGFCRNTCSGGCSGGCNADCYQGCQGGCRNSCFNTCSGGCARSAYA